MTTGVWIVVVNNIYRYNPHLATELKRVNITSESELDKFTEWLRKNNLNAFSEKGYGEYFDNRKGVKND